MPVLHPIDADVLFKGVSIKAVYAESDEVERWVKHVRGLTYHRLDWQFRWGVAHVLYLGTEVGRIKAIREVESYAYCLKGKLGSVVNTPPAHLPRHQGA